MLTESITSFMPEPFLNSEKNQSTESISLHHFIRNKLNSDVLGNPVIKIKQSEISTLREFLRKEQNDKCGLCETDLSKVVPTLDHDHITGHIRNVLCANCNGIEGKIVNLANRAKRGSTVTDYLLKIVKYILLHRTHPFPRLHPLHKTADEKRLQRNQKARELNLAKRIKKQNKSWW